MFCLVEKLPQQVSVFRKVGHIATPIDFTSPTRGIATEELHDRQTILFITERLAE